MTNASQAIEAWRRDVLNPYCLEQCEAKSCCTKFHLTGLTEKQIRVITGKRNQSLIKDMKSNGEIVEIAADSPSVRKYKFIEGPCPGLILLTGKCSVYDRPLKPEICREFPLAVRGEADLTLLFDPRCDYIVKNGTDAIDYFSGVPGIRSVHNRTVML
jgi:Fe-S-cluster containining protein